MEETGDLVLSASYARRLPHLDALRIVVPADRVEDLFRRSLQEAQKRWWKPGFRKGKPLGIRRTQLEDEVLQGVLRAVAFNAFQQVQAHLETKPIGIASIVSELPDSDEGLLKAAQPSAKPPRLQHNRGTDFTFYAVFLTHPKVVLPGSEQKQILPAEAPETATPDQKPATVPGHSPPAPPFLPQKTPVIPDRPQQPEPPDRKQLREPQ